MDAVYSSLDLSGSKVRLVKLRSEFHNDDVISCDLFIADLGAGAAFVALSYAWGDAEITEEIYVNGVSFQATVNLVAYLKRRRELHDSGLEMHTLPIWIDAICINQSDKQEKNSQVPLMRDIYRKAAKVIAWIGEPDDDETILKDQPVIIPPNDINESDEQEHDAQLSLEQRKDRAGMTLPIFRSRFLGALALIEDIGKRTDYAGPIHADHWINQSPYREALCESDYVDAASFEPSKAIPLHNTTWNTIWKIIRRRYWSRAWTIQELALPAQKDVYIQSGSAMFEYAAFIRFGECAYQITCEKPTAMLDRHWDCFRRSTALLDIVYGISKRQLFSLSFYLVYEADHQISFKKQLGIAMDLRQFKASDPRDIVYCGLGITDLPIKADYTRSVRQTYVEFTTLALPYFLQETFGTSGIGADFHPGEHNLPSWVPNWSRRHRYRPGTSSAGFLKECEEETWKKPKVEGDCLHIPAIHFDNIKLVIKIDGPGDFSRLFLRYATQADAPPQYNTGVPMAQAMLMILLHGYDLITQKSGLSPDDKHFRHNLFAVLMHLGFTWNREESAESQVFRRRHDGDTDVVKLLEWFDREVVGPGTENNPPDTTTASQFIDFCLRRGVMFVSQEMTKMLRMYHAFETESGYIGLGPKSIGVGDRIVVPLRLQTPSVFRTEDDHYIHHGKCFVLGLMNGEAIELVRQGKREVQMFEIH